jgi:pimeloyl-ACP methyl ester carboxylesterase
MGEPSSSDSGYLRNGLAYNRFGRGPRPLVIFRGLLFENKPQPARMLRMYDFLSEAYTVYSVLRKPGLPRGYTLADMAGDYAAMIREEFGGPIDVIGVSTGGSIAQHFAADYPDLLRKLVLHSAAYSLSDGTKRLQLRLADLAREGRWREAYALTLDAVLPPKGMLHVAGKPLAWVGSVLMTVMGTPEDPNDFIVTVETEDTFNFRERLGEIAAPTLVIAGAEDPFYTPQLLCETAAGIPNARLVLYEEMGHMVMGERFEMDVLGFLQE